MILLTGASGYIGGRLLKELEKRQLTIRCFARHPEYLEARVGRGTEVVQGDGFDRDSLLSALTGVHTAYYMIHSLAAKGSFVENDRRAAEIFVSAAREAGVQRIIYLGGLGEGSDLSEHLASRQEVGQILRESGVQGLEFRASIVIGSGSLSFEMVRALVEELPAMTTPKWVRSLAQPIAIEDVISYLVAALNYQGDSSAVFEIGGADQVSYEGIMRAYAQARGLKRLIIPVPVLSPGLSSLWLALAMVIRARVNPRSLIKRGTPTCVKLPHP